MKTMKHLLLREYWEHKGSFLWLPTALGGLVCALVVVSLYIASGKVMVGNVEFSDKMNEKFMDAQGIHDFANHYLGVAFPIWLLAGTVIAFYCIGALYDERRDKSVLFWRSLPVSDLDTVFAKAISALCVAPLIAMGIGLITSLLLVAVTAIAAASVGVPVIGALLRSTEFYLAPLQMIGILPVYIVWALPTVGWYLLVSAWAKSKPLLWATVTPSLTIFLLDRLNAGAGLGWNTQWMYAKILPSMLLGTIPGGWLFMDGIHSHIAGTSGGHAEIFRTSWNALLTGELWVGAVAGIAMLLLAARIRRMRDLA